MADVRRPTKHSTWCRLVPSSTAKLLAKINKHKPELSALGILPNQLRTFLKTSTHCEEALADLAQTLFWKGFKLWKKRTALVSHFWKNCPEEWKNIKERKDVYEHRACVSMFHFCSRVKNLSKQKQTLCSCSKVTLDVEREVMPTCSRTMISRKRKAPSDGHFATQDIGKQPFSWHGKTTSVRPVIVTSDLILSRTISCLPRNK